MTNRTDLIPGVIFFSYHTDMIKEKVAFLEHKTLVFLVAGHFKMETAHERVTMDQGEMLLIQKNQLAEITKMPSDGKEYQTIIIRLTEDILRMIAQEEQIETSMKYTGPANIPISGNDFLQAFFQSLLPYAQHPEAKITNAVAILKIKEAVYLLLNSRPELRKFLFDFSDPYKLDLEKFMRSNFHYNIPVSRFAQLTGRSLAAFKRDFQKIFGMAPRQWLLERRLEQARHLLEKKNKKPSAFYLDLGFESLSHFSHSFKKKFGKTPSEWVV